jgi:hypothetical protein
MSTVSVYSPVKVSVPRASNLAGNLFARLLAALQSSPRTPSASQEQAERARDAAAVREYAQRYARHDPRFAADLMAAADRHEQA